MHERKTGSLTDLYGFARMKGMEEITLQKALDDYKTGNLPYRNFADRTREEYWNHISNFDEFLQKAGVKHVKNRASYC